jgi:hypothetical protein
VSKNTHLEHLEDSILFDGEEGAKDAFTFLDALTKTFSGTQTSNFKITTKWDGAPAVICGIDPEGGDFFVGTKSVFNKTEPKINYSNQHIEVNHGNSSGLVAKLKVALEHFSKLNIRGIIQGDLLFTDDAKDEKIDGVDYLTFTPNTITYAIAKGTPAYTRAKRAKIGVVFHTRYVGSSIATAHATFGVDINQFNKTDDVFVISAEVDTLGSNMILDAPERRNLNNMKRTATPALRNASSFLDKISAQINSNDNLSVGTRLKTYFNTYVREGKRITNVNRFIGDFKQNYHDTMMKEVNKVKQKKTKAVKLKKLYDGIEFVDSNIAGLKATIILYLILQNAKNLFVKKLESADATRTFLRTDDGFRVTAPEGFVAIKDGNATKLVDRLEFSQANFTLQKNWIKGN